MKPKQLLPVVVAVAASTVLAIGVIAGLVHFGVPATTAGPVMAGIIAAIAAGLNLRREMEARDAQAKVERDAKEAQAKLEAEAREAQAKLQSSEQSVQETQSQLADVKSKLEEVEMRRRRDAAETALRARETLEAITAKCKFAPELKDIHWKDDVFINQIKWTDALAQSVKIGARLIVVASGKGGVGKSTLSLGLLEVLSRYNKTLLVDFDMHNRGLTSLLHEGDAKKRTNILAEMERFHELYESANLMASTGADAASSQVVTSFNTLRHDFASPGVAMHLRPFKGESIAPEGEVAPVHPRNGYFMPSSGVGPNDRFLSSKVFRSQFHEVYFFLKCLSYWAGNNPNSFETVILDCHGAHDHFMIGAIHAASALLVVTTPEPGAFDGTYDLLAFAKVLRHLTPGEGGDFPTVLAINNSRDWQQSSVTAIREFVKKPELDFVETVGIETDDGIRQITNTYEFGDIAKIPALWNASKAVGTAFDNYWTRRSQPVSETATIAGGDPTGSVTTAQG